MDRRPHHRGLDDAPALEPAGHRVTLEPVDPRPEADVHRGRVLRLKPAHPLEHPRKRSAHALEQHLPREERPVQLAFRQRPGHGHQEANRGPSVLGAEPQIARFSSEARAIEADWDEEPA